MFSRFLSQTLFQNFEASTYLFPKEFCVHWKISIIIFFECSLYKVRHAMGKPKDKILYKARLFFCKGFMPVIYFFLASPFAFLNTFLLFLRLVHHFSYYSGVMALICHLLPPLSIPTH